MALSMDQMMVGAVVTEYLDDKHKPLKVRRRGVIEKVVSCSGEQYNDGNGVREIWVRFTKNGVAELVKNGRLALHKAYDAALDGRLKKETQNNLGEDILAAEVEAEEEIPAVLIDHTDLAPNQSLAPSNMAEKFPAKMKK